MVTLSLELASEEIQEDAKTHVGHMSNRKQECSEKVEGNANLDVS